MRPLLVLLAASLAACAAHPAAAAGPATLDATVAGALIDGQLTLTGPLSAMTSTGQVSSQGGPLAPTTVADNRLAPTMVQLAARHLHVETDLQRQFGSPAAGTPQADHESVDFTDAIAHTTTARQKFQFYLAPVPGHAPPTARLEAVQARIEPTGSAPREPDRKVDSGRPAMQAAPGPATTVAGGLRTLHIEGDLVMTMWEWDLEVASDGALVRSGYAYTPLAPSVGNYDTVGNSEERQVFLTAEGASMDITLPYDAAVAVAMQARSAAIDGRIVLEQPRGSVATKAGAQSLRDGDWVDGAFAAMLSDLGDSSFHVTLDGTGREASLAGLTVAIRAPLPSTTGTLVATLAASGIAILGSWRLWGRRQGADAAPTGPPGPEADDELRILRWLESRTGEDAAQVLWDSDLMRAFDWSAERAQDALRGLRAKGQVRCKTVAINAGRSSLGHIALTAAGADRLRLGPAADAAQHRNGPGSSVPGR